MPFTDSSEEVERGLYAPTDKERTFISDVLKSFHDCYELRQEEQPILGGLTLKDFWERSEADYTVTLDEVQDENDPVKKYQSTISRDKANVFVAHIAGSLMYPDVIAQNPDQSIDQTWGRVGTSLLYWAHRQDGWPNENGQQKAERMAHTTTVKGTSFCLDIVTKEGLESEEIPVEEVYFSTFWQPNLQKHPVIFRAKLNLLFEEAEQMFGEYDNFKNVQKGSAWISEAMSDELATKTSFEGIVQEEKVSILYVYKMARPKELEALKKKGKVRKGAKRACFYNVIVNGIPMFDVDNILPYKHGYYPITKALFEMFRSDYLYGNSCPNKMREDKRWKDEWKTLMRYKGKLGALPPQLVIGGSIDEQMTLPGAQTSVPVGVEVQAVPGVQPGISSSDIQLMQMGDAEIDRSTTAPQTAGIRGDKQTARAEVIQATNAQKMLEPFSRQWAYFMQSRSFHILLSMLQYIPKRSVKKIAVPDQTLQDGLTGTFEVIFEDVRQMEAKEKLQRSMDIMREERKSRRSGTPKEQVFVSPQLVDEIRFFLFSDASAGLEDKNLIKQQDFTANLELMLSRPEFVPGEVAREFVRLKGYNERILAKGQPQAPVGPQNALGQAGAPQMPTEGDITANAAGQAATGETMPALA
ncbi:MAG: hypothetical protein WC763_05160 [Candidatus Paceibacterota bacterium]|jgi:hypothetical protein